MKLVLFDLDDTLFDGDTEGEWVKLAFPARGADIEYVLTDGYTGTRMTQAE